MKKVRSSELRPAIPPGIVAKRIDGDIFEHAKRDAIAYLKRKGWGVRNDRWVKRNPDCDEAPQTGKSWRPWLGPDDMTPEEELSYKTIVYSEEMTRLLKSGDITGALRMAYFVGHFKGMAVVGHRQKVRYRAAGAQGGDAQTTSRSILKFKAEWEMKPENKGRIFKPSLLEKILPRSTPAARRQALHKAKQLGKRHFPSFE